MTRRLSVFTLGLVLCVLVTGIAFATGAEEEDGDWWEYTAFWVTADIDIWHDNPNDFVTQYVEDKFKLRLTDIETVGDNTTSEKIVLYTANIGKNISLHPDFNEMVGFTMQEVRHLVETYRELGVFNQEVATAMGIMGQWYNGYRFAEETVQGVMPRLAIPNQTVKRLMYGYLRDAYRDVGVRSVSTWPAA